MFISIWVDTNHAWNSRRMNFLSLIRVYKVEENCCFSFCCHKVLFATLSLLITHLVSNSPACDKYAKRN